MTRRSFVAVLIVAIATSISASVISATLGGAAQRPASPILILVSIDAWRWDLIDRADAPNLKALAARGVRSQGLIPSYPTLTFPNHYTIVTGLTPDHHGIVSNSMFDRTIGPDKFTMSSATAKNPKWWGGEPIWTTAIRQGRKSASMFWPGSEAVSPTYWKPFDDALPNVDRVNQLLDWLKLPETDRPSFLTIYFSDVDTAAHRTGPNSPEVLAAATRVDEMLGLLVRGVEQLGFGNRTTFVIVSDHGMAETSSARTIYLSDYLGENDAEIVNSGAELDLNPRAPITADVLYLKLAGKHPSLAVYRREQLPSWLQYGRHPRVPAIVGLVEAGWAVSARRPSAPPPPTPRIGGAHGYDPRYREMHGLFVAAGPAIREGVIVPEFHNIHIYEFMCAVLGLTPAANDGDRTQTKTMLK